jgi:hypothetical protein
MDEIKTGFKFPLGIHDIQCDCDDEHNKCSIHIPLLIDVFNRFTCEELNTFILYATNEPLDAQTIILIKIVSRIVYEGKDALINYNAHTQTVMLVKSIVNIEHLDLIKDLLIGS